MTKIFFVDSIKNGSSFTDCPSYTCVLTESMSLGPDSRSRAILINVSVNLKEVAASCYAAMSQIEYHPCKENMFI